MPACSYVTARQLTGTAETEKFRNGSETTKLQHQSVTGAEKFALFGRGDAGVGGQAVEMVEATGRR